MITTAPLCLSCEHFYRRYFGPGNRYCKAFPTTDGIPEEIWSWEFVHTEPYDGDRGYQFKPVSEEDLRRLQATGLL